MTAHSQGLNGPLITGLRIAGWSAAAALLLLPLVLNAPWTALDFVFAAVMLGGTGLLAELAVRKAPNLPYLFGAGAALAAAFMIVWASAAVGMIGDGDHPLNLMFAGVLGIALVGTLLARFRPGGIALTMVVAALAQVVAGLAGISVDVIGGLYSAGFAIVWLVAAALFAKSARELRSAR